MNSLRGRAVRHDWGRLALAVALSTSTALAADPAHAEDPNPNGPMVADATAAPLDRPAPPADLAAPSPPEAIRPLQTRTSLRWKEEWGRAKPLEYASTLTFGAAMLASTAIPVKDRGWGGNGFDDAMRGGLRLRDPGARSTARGVSDFMFYGIMAYPLVVDTLLVAGPKNGDVAWQMFVINLHSLAVSGFASVAIERISGRTRPFVRQCTEDPSDAEDCDTSSSEKYQSFISGHTLMASTGAGLVCAHHARLPLYGGGLADIAACGVAVTGAAVQGLLRVAADRHYFTDVAVGSALGFASGYAMPMLLHYGRGGSGDSTTAVHFVSPYTNGQEMGLQAAGAF